MHYFMSLGFGGKGLAESRPNDSYGIGYYYMWVRSPKFTAAPETRSLLGNENGGEMYYSFAVTPWALLTPDLQVVRPAQQDSVSIIRREHIETAVIMGVRLKLVF